MTEFFTPEQVALLSATTVRCDFLVKFEFVSQTVYAWNGHTELTVAGNTYLPMHGYGEISGLGYGGGTTADSITLSLSGIPNGELDFLALAIAETDEAAQQIVTVSLQLFDEDWQPIGAPIPVSTGFMQPPKISRSPVTAEFGAVQSITMTAENVFFNRSKPPHGRNTHSDQNARYLGDNGFGFVSKLLFKQITFPDY